MNLVRGRIGNYFKYIGTMNSFFYSIEFYWMSTGDQILWRFRIYKNNLCPCPEVLWVITPSVSYVIPIRVAIHMLHVFTKADSCTWHFLYTSCCAGHQRNYKDEQCQMRYILTTQYATFYNRSIPTHFEQQT